MLLNHIIFHISLQESILFLLWHDIITIIIDRQRGKEMVKNQWWKANYINTRDWLLDKYEVFNLSPQEGILVLMIDLLNHERKPISLEVLAEKCNLSLDETDRALNILCSKKYLSIQVNQNSVEFDLSGLYNEEKEKPIDAFSQSTFDLFESEFARLLSKSELERLSEWVMTYDEKLVVYALREAVMYKNLNFNYINKILLDWKKKGVTVETLEQRNETE